MTAAAPAVDIASLEHSYGSHPALAGVSFSVARGEIFALLGPNGGGKTTLFRVVSTLLAPQRGTVQVLGEDVVRQRTAVRRRLGVVFQAPALDRKLTVRENLRHQGHLYGLHGADLERRIGTALERFKLGERRDSLIESLSGGLRRRVEIAKGLLHGPELLLLDEPSTGLDPGARRDLWQLLHEIRSAGGVTVLLTSHILEEVERADRVAILERGRLVALGTPRALKESVGGDVLSIATADPERLAAAIAAEVGLQPAVLDGMVRLEGGVGPDVVRQIQSRFGAEVEAMTLAKPTLDDVFIRVTGHRFWGAAGEDA